MLCASCSANPPTFTVLDKGVLIDTKGKQTRGCVKRLSIWQGQRVVFESQVYRSCARYIFASDRGAKAGAETPYAVELMFDDTPEGLVILAQEERTNGS